MPGEAGRPHHKVLVFLYRRDPDRVLLLRRPHDTGDHWHPVTGHVDPTDPSLLAAALREVEEETGLRLASVEPLSEGFRFAQVRDGVERVYEEHAFAAPVTGPAGEVRLSPEHVAFAWFSFKNAAQALRYPQQRRLLEDLLARLPPLLPPDPPPPQEAGADSSA